MISFYLLLCIQVLNNSQWVLTQMGLKFVINVPGGKYIGIVRGLGGQLGMGGILIAQQVFQGCFHLNGQGDEINILGSAVSSAHHTASDQPLCITFKNEFGANRRHTVHHRISIQYFGISGHRV